MEQKVRARLAEVEQGRKKLEEALEQIRFQIVAHDAVIEELKKLLEPASEPTDAVS